MSPRTQTNAIKAVLNEVRVLLKDSMRNDTQIRTKNCFLKHLLQDVTGLDENFVGGCHNLVDLLKELENLECCYPVE